jgi:hypothetical protein
VKSKGDAGDNINVKIGGSVHDGGQVAAGRRINQSYTRYEGRSSVVVSEADLAELHRAIQDVKAQILAEAPEEQQAAALGRVNELEEAITAKEPDLTTLQYVRRWFARNLPKLAGAITGIVVHPVVGKIVEAAGDLAAKQFREQFGDASEG